MKILGHFIIIVFLSACASKLPKSKELAVFADAIEISITESSDGLKFRTLSGTDLYLHTPLKASELIGYVESALELEKKFKNDRRHIIDEKKSFYKEHGLMVNFNYLTESKNSIFIICFRPQNQDAKDPAVCEGVETWKAKRMIEPLTRWSEVKKELN